MNGMIWFYGLALPLLIIVFTWASWAGALLFSARASGWSELAKHYSKPFPESSSPRLLRRLGLGQNTPLMYNNAVRARIQNRRLYLRPTLLAKSSHKPLAIPLADLEFEIDGRINKRGRVATLKACPDRNLWFTKDDAAWIQAAKGKA